MFRCYESCVDPADGICYFILHDTYKYSHNEGATACQNNGGRLAVLDTSSKADLAMTCGVTVALG